MNREIKFRAWDDAAKQWLFGYEMPNLGGFSLYGEIMLMGEWSQILDQFIFERNGHKQDDLKVMQFTGLKDKNGKDIYEGDITRRINTDGIIEICEVKYKAPYWSIRDYNPIYGYTVIGNIYENPELTVIPNTQ